MLGLLLQVSSLLHHPLRPRRCLGDKGLQLLVLEQIDESVVSRWRRTTLPFNRSESDVVFIVVAQFGYCFHRRLYFVENVRIMCVGFPGLKSTLVLRNMRIAPWMHRTCHFRLVGFQCDR